MVFKIPKVASAQEGTDLWRMEHRPLYYNGQIGCYVNFTAMKLWKKPCRSLLGGFIHILHDLIWLPIPRAGSVPRDISFTSFLWEPITSAQCTKSVFLPKLPVVQLASQPASQPSCSTTQKAKCFLIKPLPTKFCARVVTPVEKRGLALEIKTSLAKKQDPTK